MTDPAKDAEPKGEQQCLACEWLASLNDDQLNHWFFTRTDVPVSGICVDADLCCRLQAGFNLAPKPAKKLMEDMKTWKKL